MIELQTFGRLDLRDERGQDMSSVLAHAKRVALLTYLATARPFGFHRRDTLLGLLWPELDQDRARAALRKAVHHLRRSLGESVLIGRGDEELALNPAAFASDAKRFQDTLELGDAKAALAFYQGVFLPGFFVSDAPAFEQWLELERQRLHSLAFRAASSLAENAEASNDAFGAAHWARRAAELVPADEAAVRNLMSLLLRIGDRAGALAAYEEFARRLRREFDVDPVNETRALATAARQHDNRVSLVVTEIAPVIEMARPARTHTLKRNRLFAALSLAAIAVLFFSSGVQFAPGDKGSATARVIAVMPFTYRGHNEFAYLGEGMVNLLSTNLDHIGDFRSVDAAGVLKRADHTKHFDANAGGSTAIDLGAGLFVLGDIVEANGRLRVSARLFEARRPDRWIARASSEGDVAQLFNIIDAVTSQLLAGERRAPSERFTRLALLTTHSVAALKAYLTGEQQFRAGRYNEAVESFQRAVTADTTFALGYYRLALAHMWGSNDSDRAAAERAIAHGKRLAGPDRALLEALLPFFRGDADEAERQYRSILVRRPDESEVWYPLGEVLFHHNPMRGRPAAEAREAFEKALTLGPKDGPLTHLVEIAAIERDYVAFDTLFTGIQRASHFYFIGEMVQVLRSGDASARARTFAALRDSSDARLLSAARHAMYLLEDAAPSESVLHLLTEARRPPELRSWGYVHRAHLALGGGNLKTAFAALDSATSLDAARALEHEAWLISLPFAGSSRQQLARMRNRLNAWTPPHNAEADVLRADREIHLQVRTYLLGLISALLGDDAAALQAADELPLLAGTPVAKDLGADLAHAVRAEVLRNRGKSAEALAELQQSRMQFDANRLGLAPFYAQTRERFVRAQLLTALGRADEALDWYASFAEHGPWGRALLAQAVLQQARIHDAAGRYNDAVQHYGRFIGLWQDAEPRFRPEVEHAKQRLVFLKRHN